MTLTLDSFTVLIGAVYLPPNAPLSVFESHTSSVEQLVSSLNPRYTLVCGDYNISQVSWYVGRLGLNATGCLTSSSHLVDSFSFLNLFQLNQIPNSHGVLLDLIFSSSNELSVSCAPTPIVRPDAYHPPLFFLLLGKFVLLLLFINLVILPMSKTIALFQSFLTSLKYSNHLYSIGLSAV